MLMTTTSTVEGRPVAQYLGMCDRLVKESVQYAVDRKQFGQPIGAFQLVQGMIADSRTEAYATWLMTQDVARRFDAGENVSADVASTKYFASRR